MNKPAWSSVKSVFQSVVDLPETERGGELDRLCVGDAALRAEVDLLLAAHRATDHVLNPESGAPIGAAMAAMGLDAAPCEVASAGTEGFMQGSRIGRYVLGRQIGEGGMGRVFEAHDMLLGRRVAVKVLGGLAGRGRGGNREGGEAVKRFEHEAKALARLDHPAVARVHDAGVHSIGDSVGAPTPYFAMELVENARDIVSYAREQKLDLRTCLGLFLQACSGVAHGHQLGIIHRDIKPDNLLVDARGQVKVIDFGVALMVAASDGHAVTRLTHGGDLVGSLRYMSPEQAGESRHGVDVRSDVYSLGVVLYELLTGQMPYACDGSSIVRAVQAIRSAPPIRPASISPRFPADVEIIVLKALAKDIENRYQSVAALAQDLERFLQGRAIEARPPSTAYVVRMFALRHKAFLTGVLVVFGALVVGIILTSINLRRALRAEAATASALGAAREL